MNMFKYKSLYKNFANENHMAKFVKKSRKQKRTNFVGNIKEKF